MQSGSYWQKRAAARMERYLRDSGQTVQIIGQTHRRAQKEIQDGIERLYAKFGKDYDLTSAEARKMLAAPCGRAEYERLLAQIAAIQDPALRKPLEARASSGGYAYRVSRLEALKDTVRVQAMRIADVALRETDAGFARTVRDAFLRSTFDIQKGTGIGYSFANMSAGAVQEILRSPWSGEHYSRRIWKNANALTQTLHDTITVGFQTGKSNVRIAQEVAESMGVSQRAAERLVRTETCYMANAAEMQSYKEAGLSRYQYMATLDDRTSPACQALDGKVFYVKDAVPGENMPPLHPYCRSTTVAYFDAASLKDLQRSARDPVTGETRTVPRSMTFTEWERSL